MYCLVPCHQLRVHNLHFGKKSPIRLTEIEDEVAPKICQQIAEESLHLAPIASVVLGLHRHGLNPLPTVQVFLFVSPFYPN